jgi:type II secretory ATPase GspE/PulE/Tfp pilus assembly ATPase PilB-like protein
MRGLTLAQAFKHLLRQDPDVIALGEIRDRESLKEALQAGLSGHKVLATFHAGNGSETLARLRQIAGDEYLVMSGLQAILHLELSHEAGKIMAKAELTEIAESKL